MVFGKRGCLNVGPSIKFSFIVSPFVYYEILLHLRMLERSIISTMCSNNYLIGRSITKAQSKKQIQFVFKRLFMVYNVKSDFTGLIWCTFLSNEILFSILFIYLHSAIYVIRYSMHRYRYLGNVLVTYIYIQNIFVYIQNI